MKAELRLDPPIDDFAVIEEVMREAFQMFLTKGYNGCFRDIYDLVHEEIENNGYKYILEKEDYDVCCY